MNQFTISMVLDMVDRITKPLRKSNRAMKDTAEVAERAQKRLERAGNASRSFDVMSRRIRNTNRLLRDHELRLRVTGRLQKQLQVNQKRLGKLRGDLAGSAIGAGAALTPAIAAARTEQVELQLRTVLNADDKNAAMRQARETSRRLAQAGIAGLQESLEIQYGLNSAGLTAKLSAVSAETVAKIATITRGSTGAVTGVMATAYNNLGDSLKGSAEEQFTRIGEIMAKTQLKYKIDNFDQLGESFVEATAAANAAKLPFDQLSVALGMLNTGGLAGSRGGTALSATLRQLTKASEEFGFNIIRGADGFMDLEATLKNLDSALSVFDDIDERSDAMQQAFGDEGKKGIGILLRQLDKFRDDQRIVAEESRSMIDPEYARFKASTAGEWKRFKGTVMTLADSFGRTLLPAINKILSKSSDFLGYVANLAERFPGITQAISMTVAGLAILRVGFIGAKLAGLLFKSSILTGHLGVLKFTGLLPVLATGLGGLVTGIKAVGLAMAANPLGLAIAAIAGAAALVIYNWDTVKGFLMTIWDPVKPVWERFMKWVEKAWSIISAPLNLLGRLTGIGGDPGLETVEAGQAAAKNIARNPKSAAQLMKERSVQTTRTISAKPVFHIHAAPGQDPDEIAQKVKRMLENSDPGALYDTTD